MQLTVSSIVCQGCADTITKAVKNLDGHAVVQVDVATKQVLVESQADEAAVKAAIAATGHQIAE
jgi:copper chaperone